MAGASVGQYLHRPCSVRNTLKKCKNNPATDNVVFIDVDADDLENVVVIDSPELCSKKLCGLSVSKEKQHQRRVIICIDDEESTDNEHPDIEVTKRCNFSSGASLNKGPGAASENHDKFRDEVIDDCESVEIISSPETISNCKQTYSEKAPPRNRYGLGSESDCFSNDEFLNCEFVEEDFSGSVSEQWEKAFSKRKYENRNGRTGVMGCRKTSRGSCKSSYCGQKVAFKQPNEFADFSSWKKVSCEKAGSSPSTATEKIPQFTISKTKRRSLAVPVSKSVLKEHAPYNEANSDCGSNPLAEDASMDCGEDQYDHNPEPEGSSFNPGHSSVEIDLVTEFSQPRETSETMKEDSSRSPQVHREQASEGSVAEQLKESLAFSISKKPTYKRKNSSPLSEIGNLSPESSSKRGNFGGHILMSLRKGWLPLNKTSSHSKSDLLVEKSKMDCDESQYRQNFEHCNHIDRPLQGEELHQQRKPQNYVNEMVQEKNDYFLGSAESCMISDREKLKETDEYKKAIEEEWAARRQALQIQAEEAKQLRLLRKRENAERMRLLDVDRRQKQRVKEIRENMKKDEEEMNMKDLIRAEVRNELSKVEITCCDMASLLRSLGIEVGTQLRPNAKEVRSAYKKALLTFHPDRASNSNTRHQVEAEEKFKLISRMKEKFAVA